MRKIIGLALLVLLALVPFGAIAETCNSPAYAVWSSPAAGGWTGSPCTPAAGDDFIIQNGDTVVVTALLAFNSGTTTVTCESGGTLRIAPGAGFNFTSSTNGSVVIQPGCTFEADGAVVWEGRIGSGLTYASGPARATFTVAGSGDPSAVATTSDYLYFDDEISSLGFAGAIASLVQTVTGFPLAGYLRPSYNQNAWYKVQALAATTITYHTNQWADVDGGTATGTTATSPYGGTRGPALTSATALAGNVRTRGGILTKLQIDLAGVTMDGDLGSQYVVFETGTCAGKRAKILMVDANTAGTPDDLYVDGDASSCGLANITIDFGARLGDPVKLVRPVIIDGGNVAHVEIRGGSIAAEWVLFKNLDDHNPPGNIAYCNLCVLKHAAGAAPPTGYMRRIANLYTNVVAGNFAVGALGLLNWNGTATNYFQGTGQTVDLSGIAFDYWYTADTRLNATGGTCPTTCEGVHGVLAEGVTGFKANHWRVERITDDGIAWIANDFGQGNAENATLKHWMVYEIWTTDTLATNSNSQQCFDLTGGQSSGTQTILSRVVLEDAIGAGCKDGGLSAKLLNSRFNRVLLGGTNGGVWSLGVSGHTLLPSGALGTYPNRISNSKIYQLNAANQNLQLGATLEDSILAGNVIGTANGGFPYSPIGFYRSLVDLGNDTGIGGFLDRFNSQDWGKIASVPVVDSVFLLASAGAKTVSAANSNCSGVACFDQSPAATLNLSRVFFGMTTISNGFFWDAATADNAFRVSGSNIVVSTSTPAAAGARGLNVTQAGANLTRTCVETTLANALTNAVNYGASVTSSSIELPVVRPDAANDVPLSVFLQRVSPMCDPPRRLGLAQIGGKMLLGGDLAIDSLDAVTTDDTLLRSVLGSGMTGPQLEPFTVGP